MWNDLETLQKHWKKKKKKGKAVFAPHLVSILSQAFCGGRAALPRRWLLSSKFRPQGPQWWEEFLMRIARAWHPTLYKVLPHKRPYLILMPPPRCRNKGQAILFHFIDKELRHWRWWVLRVSGEFRTPAPLLYTLCFLVIDEYGF